MTFGMTDEKRKVLEKHGYREFLSCWEHEETGEVLLAMMVHCGTAAELDAALTNGLAGEYAKVFYDKWAGRHH
jgi:hypothetical protein